ncbi:bifunctional 4-hydroxy-2-oxoglutarate aldolase/2-dehydro-3-deoxy-phosphogluconate aldolase [Salinicola sp. DM10]|uniref:bifunctional 4-hydroxy-2-oxoglutarate aldolase/2-dehydro-3-deoxy-phosphogluconate aldolase n=1 Tax=Salinicola sp. DM10 TaxID=2815721 RepID=UPI001A906268|nr:bifunctional 4-hydroxy-2-oxoglutarate aldolase/2-dehydro-3-deoxy-phosphogluconate aldolase [Salinicola sp. DM10]MCE3028332.1 bifunctional 4-hydroxy-2-oxoglutarate aldolase/2-dehydro-3-deoxy-phosphogluconate aldolase [Salinicola sp. DM10]
MSSAPHLLPQAQTDRLDAICRATSIIPVLVIERLDHAVPLAQALVDGGLDVLEITLRTDCAVEAMQRIREALPEVTLGAGTVLGVEQYRICEELGVDFVVTPGTTPALFEHGIASEVPLLPGVATVSEVVTGWARGYRRFKFFPAEANGGAKALKSFGGPLPEALFCPTGGVTVDNAADYLALPNVMCVGGSWMAAKALIDQQDWEGITRLTREATQRYPR